MNWPHVAADGPKLALGDHSSSRNPRFSIRLAVQLKVSLTSMNRNPIQEKSVNLVLVII